MTHDSDVCAAAVLSCLPDQWLAGGGALVGHLEGEHVGVCVFLFNVRVRVACKAEHVGELELPTRAATEEHVMCHQEILRFLVVRFPRLHLSLLAVLPPSLPTVSILASWTFYKVRCEV